MRGSASGKSGYGRWRARTENPATLERENNYGRSKEGDLRGAGIRCLVYTGRDECGKSDAQQLNKGTNKLIGPSRHAMIDR
jgi:hypothetical protein